MKSLQDTITLSNGYKIPCIGFGTWQIPEGEVAIQSVLKALESGYRHIDTAAAYDNEKSVGRAIKESGIKREDLFVTSKLWNRERGYEKTLAACKKSLFDLQLDYLDLYLIHWPAAQGDKSRWTYENSETWQAFEQLYNEGILKAIGVCNFKPHHLEPLLKTATIVPMVDQIEFHPGFVQAETREFCTTYDILVEAWSPLGSGQILNDARLRAIAEKYNRSVAQICIRWCLQQQTLPLPKSVHPKRIEENTKVFDFEISEEDVATINSFETLGFSGLDPDTNKF